MACCKNVGGVDRVVRGVAGIAAVGAGLFALKAMEGNAVGIAVAAVGGVLLLTALIGFCPAYVPFKASTCSTRR